MKLTEYLSSPGESQGRLASSLGISQSAISQWVKRGVPAERVPAVVRATKGAVTAHELRPDLYPEGFVFPEPASEVDERSVA